MQHHECSSLFLIAFGLLYCTRNDENPRSIYSRFYGITVPEGRCSPEIDSKFAPRADRRTRHSRFDSIVTDIPAVVTFNSHTYLCSIIETSSFDCSDRIRNRMQSIDDEWDETDYNQLLHVTEIVAPRSKPLHEKH